MNESEQNASVVGACGGLHLDFINLFLIFLRLTGRRRLNRYYNLNSFNETDKTNGKIRKAICQLKTYCILLHDLFSTVRIHSRSRLLLDDRALIKCLHGVYGYSRY